MEVEASLSIWRSAEKKEEKSRRCVGRVCEGAAVRGILCSSV